MAADLESLALALIGVYSRNITFWKTRRFHVFVFHHYAAYADHRFEHIYAAGGL